MRTAHREISQRRGCVATLLGASPDSRSAAPQQRPAPLKRQGITSVLAMMYLCLFSVLAIGFYASATMSTQLAGNEKQGADAQSATESGLQFVKYQMASLN